MGADLFQLDGVWCRPGTYDEYIVKECRRQYEALDLRPEDEVVDIGANIGAWTVIAALQSATVVAFEPDPDNFSLLERNTEGMLNVETRQLAVMPETGTVDFFLSPGPNKGSHSTVIARGRTPTSVEAVAWELAIEGATVLKVDVEGAQYLWDWTILPDMVRAVAVELDLGRKSFHDEALRLVGQLAIMGFETVRAPVLDKKYWHTIGVYRRG